MLLAPIASLVVIWGFAASLTVQSGQELLKIHDGYEYVVLPTRKLTTALQHERLLSLSVLGDIDVSRTELDAQRIRTNGARAELERLTTETRSSITPDTWDRLGRLFGAMDRLTEIRSGVDTRTDTRLQILDAYSGVVSAAFDTYEKIRISSDIELTDQARAVVMVGRSREILSQQAALISGAVIEGAMSPAERARFSELVTGRRLLYSLGFDQFDAEFRALYTPLHDSPDYSSFEGIENAVATAAIPDPSWSEVATRLSDGFDSRAGDVNERISERSIPLARDILVQIGLAGGLGLVTVGLSVFVSVRFGRRLGGELVDLQRAALDLADKRLPDVVRRLRRGEEVRSEAPEINVGSTTEVARVSKAFSSVQRTAIEAAIGQAEIRKGVNKVFVSLARRSQSLLHRQLAMLETMEGRARDPETLEDLFGLDHLTTRMRRHSEGLIILSGAVPGRGWRTPVTIYDVVRAAVEEIEDYPRVTIGVPHGPSVIGAVVTDVIHLVAELVENATVFSPPHTSVHVNGEMVARGYAIEVEDRGLGISPEEMARLNVRLADPPEFDLADSDRLGLFVVAQLAIRHGIRVSLRPSPFGGTTAIVLLPSELVVEPLDPRFTYSVELERPPPGNGLPKRVRQTVPAERGTTSGPVAETTPESRGVRGAVPNGVLASFRDERQRAGQEDGP
ncbi:nitrate- and nitrite sensing domain-containing protein [Streptosporangium sp. NBC_01755]|uniref:sensor histidine kinase n=1 Tax=unclassified Streptosporangium TaxID=2632669 RepID=UPI002DD9C9FF|nr:MULTISPECIES: nitrate- and nitrite sensing domain-containing protein [unclassified Streptosporangium]WSA24795.1 nitrate- and nitrite sensing domain-containing protein [Streptosporangium sp. NBC_01810]WSC97126.1 nitrate- and nitrite sensing domain-containing protein [Streptosporangium sp. NBC_01755]